MFARAVDNRRISLPMSPIHTRIVMSGNSLGTILEASIQHEHVKNATDVSRAIHAAFENSVVAKCVHSLFES